MLEFYRTEIGERNSKRSYFRTSREILDKVKKQVQLRKAPKKIYGEIDNESSGVFDSTPQGAGLRDTHQVYRQAGNVKKEKNSDPSENASDDLMRAIKLQRTNPEFIKFVSCTQNSFYIFLGTTVQLDDVAMMCNNFDDVLCVDTTFNLCSYWLTDCYYKNFRLKNSNGNQPNFVDPSLNVHFPASDKRLEVHRHRFGKRHF